jgi:hypothetical protein
MTELLKKCRIHCDRRGRCFVAFLALCLACSLGAFDWPEADVLGAGAFALRFGQFRGGHILGSLIFAAPKEVRSSDPGTILAVVRDPEDGSPAFHSTLGNTVILLHADDLLSIYGNLREIILDPREGEIPGGTPLGFSGSSGWQYEAAGTGRGLEFQVADTKHSRLIHPWILMPRLPDEPPLRIYGISVMDKNRESYRLAERPSFPTGIYLFYHDVDPQRIPYRTTLSVNGMETESLTMNMITEREGKHTIQGRHYYTQEELYPDAGVTGTSPGRRMLIGEATLIRGRNMIRISAFNVNNTEESSLSYVVENY